MIERRCEVCGEDLDDSMRSDALVCNSACRARKTRIKQGLEPNPDTYGTFIRRVAQGRRRRPARRTTEAATHGR